MNSTLHRPHAPTLSEALRRLQQQEQVNPVAAYLEADAWQKRHAEQAHAQDTRQQPATPTVSAGEG